MKIKILTVAILLFGSVFAEEIIAHDPNFKKGYVVAPSAIVPRWSGAQPGEWTMDYNAALTSAKAEERYTLMLFSGMWWCPHCQALEERVLSTQEFQDYVATEGYYLTVLDFPYRDGISNWCWMWDPEYVAKTGMNAEQISDEIISRFEFQNSMTKGGAVTTNLNVSVDICDGKTNLVERTGASRTTVYQRVSYPTIIVFGPDGAECGRFTFNKSTPAEGAVDLVISQIGLARGGGVSELVANPTQGGFSGAAAESYVGWLADGGSAVGSFSIKTGKRNKKTGLSKITATITPAGGRKLTLSGSMAAPVTNVFVTLTAKTGEKALVNLGANGLTGVCIVGEKRLGMDGARDAFKTKDTEVKARANWLETGYWTLGLCTEDAGSDAFARGSAGLSIQVKAKGKVKVTGTLGDGVKVSASTQAVMGDDGLFAVPVNASMYSKKGGFGFVAFIKNGLLVDISGLRDWVAVSKKYSFSKSYTVKNREAPGAGAFPEALRFEISSLTLSEIGVDDEAVSIEFAPQGTKLKGHGETDYTLAPVDFALSFATKTGLFKGSMTVTGKGANGKARKIKGKVFGAVVNGYGEGTAVFPNVGTFRVRLVSACGGEGC